VKKIILPLIMVLAIVLGVGLLVMQRLAGPGGNDPEVSDATPTDTLPDEPQSAPDELRAPAPSPSSLPTGFQVWIDRFAAPTPYSAQIKTLPPDMHISTDVFKVIQSGRSLIPLPRPFNIRGVDINEFDFVTDAAGLRSLFDSSMESRLAEAKPLERPGAGVNILLQNVSELIISAPENQLNLFWLSEARSYDLFFGLFLEDPDRARRSGLEAKRTEMLYARSPWDQNTPFYTPEFYSLMDAIDGVQLPRRTIADLSVYAVTPFAERYYHYWNLQQERIRQLKLMQDLAPDIRPRNLVLSYWPGLRATEAIESLPPASDLMAMGLTTVMVALEAPIKSIEDLEKGARTPVAYEARDFEADLLAQKNSALSQKYREGIVVFPAENALARVLRTYEAAGLTILFRSIQAE
jgi:hypothetical protein